MLTGMTDEDWDVVLRVFRASRSRRGDKGRDDRKFLECCTISLFTTSHGGPCLRSMALGTLCGSASGV
jgi:hypothetical protein